MTSNLITAAVIAVSALASFNSFADGINGRAPQATTESASVSRAAVRADLVQAKQNGLSSTIDNSFPGNAARSSNALTRSEVRAELVAAGGASRAFDSNTYSH
jgi:hypothetical protein